MENKPNGKPVKLGSSNNSIGEKTYSSFDAPNLKQEKEIHIINGKETSLINKVQKSVDNQANTVKTSIQNNSTDTRTNIKNDTLRNIAQKKGGIKTNIVRTNTLVIEGGKKIQSSNSKTSSELKIFNKSVLNQKSEGKVTPIKSNIQRQAAITFTSKTTISNKPVTNRIMPKSFSSMSNDIKNKIHDTLNNENDSGTFAISTAISIGTVGVKVFKAAQYTAPHFVNAVKNTYGAANNISPYVVKAAKGTYNVGSKTVKVVRTIDSTIANIKYGVIPLNAQTVTQFSKLTANKIIHSQPVKRLSMAAKAGQTAVRNYAMLLNNGTLKAIEVTRGVINGTTTVQVAKTTLNNIRYATFKGIRLTGRTIGFAVIKGAEKGLDIGLWSVKRGGKGVLSAVVGVGSLLSSSEDMGAQSIGVGIKSAQLTGRFIKTAPNVITRGVQGVKSLVVAPIKTVKAIYHGGKGVAGLVRIMRKIGLRDTVRYFRAQSLRAFASAGKSVVTLVMQGLRVLSMKFAIPLLIVVLVVVAISNMSNAPLEAVSAIFGGSFTVFSNDKSSSTDFEVHTYLQSTVVSLKQKVVTDVMNIRNTNLVPSGQYHYIRLFTGNNTNPIEVSESNINNAMYSTPDLVQIIEPLFKCIILTEYNLEPTQDQVDSTLNNIWNTIVKINTKELPTEYCNDICPECHQRHANVLTCPNIISGKHGVYICSSCCYKLRHISKVDDWYTDECNGYHYCNGHKILGIYMNIDGYYALLAKHFTDPIDELSNLATRTTEQEEKLQTLKDNYELCLEYMKQFQDDYGGELGNTDLSGVVFVNGTRASNNALIDLAKMQVGNIGGQPFWSWYGFDGRVEWCACFVSWCSNQMGYINSGKAYKFCYCPDGVNWFKNKSQWAVGGYQQPVAGDVIFFDWDLDGVANHVGLVIGNDGNKVYTVEGNSGDMCRIRSYSLDSSVILGYGLPNY